jgi:hypothetical protein
MNSPRGKQRQAETRLNEEVDRKSKEELRQEDCSKNLKWMAVGRKKEKLIVKGREGWDGPATGSNTVRRSERRDQRSERMDQQSERRDQQY